MRLQGCLLSQPNTFQEQHSKQMQEQNNQCKGVFFLSCLLSQPNTFQEQHSKQKHKNKTTSAKDFFVLRLPPFTARYLPRPIRKTPQTKTQEQNNKHKGFFVLRLPPLTAKHRTPSKNNIPNKNTRCKGHPKHLEQMHLGGRRCALPPNPPPAFFF